MYDRLVDGRGTKILQAEHKFGANPDAHTSEGTVWDAGVDGAAYPWAAIAAGPDLELVSGDADDTAEGAGARTVQVDGLDSDFALQSEVVTTNGATAVALTKTFVRIYRMKVLTAGTSLTNEGAITLRDVSNTPTFAQIIAGKGQTLMAVYTIPAGYKAFMDDFYASVAKGKDATFSLYVRPFGGAFNLRGEISLYQAYGTYHWKDPLPIDAKSDIDLRAISENVNTPVKGGFHLRMGTTP